MSRPGPKAHDVPTKKVQSETRSVHEHVDKYADQRFDDKLLELRERFNSKRSR